MCIESGNCAEAWNQSECFEHSPLAYINCPFYKPKENKQ